VKTKHAQFILESTEIEWMLTSTLADKLKDILTSLVFLLAFGLFVVLFFVLQTTSLGSLIGISFIGTVFTCLCADAFSSWIRKWTPSWKVLAIFQRGHQRFVVVKDRIGRKRTFMFDGIWTEVDASLPNKTLSIVLNEVIRLNDQYRTSGYSAHRTMCSFLQLGNEVQV
jgi:small-conductance mechanosensitive channel